MSGDRAPAETDVTPGGLGDVALEVLVEGRRVADRPVDVRFAEHLALSLHPSFVPVAVDSRSPAAPVDVGRPAARLPGAGQGRRPEDSPTPARELASSDCLEGRCAGPPTPRHFSMAVARMAPPWFLARRSSARAPRGSGSPPHVPRRSPRGTSRRGGRLRRETWSVSHLTERRARSATIGRGKVR